MDLLRILFRWTMFSELFSATWLTLAGLLLSGCGVGAASNTPPVASAGPIQNVTTGTLVTLNGGASSDANGDSLNYSWTLTSKPASSNATLASTNSVTPTFTADLAGEYVATLVVSDGKDNSVSASVTITATVGNAAPVANAGPLQNAITGTHVTLNGSTSTDANGDPLTYVWTLISKPASSTATLSDVTSATPTFTADVTGEYIVSLVVNDGKGNSVSTSVTITATESNAAPIADVGSIQNVTTGTQVTLNGGASSDADGDLLAYRWTLVSKPIGSTATLLDSTSASSSFTADLAGSYVASLIVNDGKVNSDPTNVTITATVINAAPVANAGVIQNVTIGTPVTLNGSASSDADGDPLTYSWILTSKPANSIATLSGETSTTPVFKVDLEGTYVASLIVNDGKVNSASTSVTITATAGNATPVANAGSTQSVKTGTLVTLDGNASSDANGDLLTYNWKMTSKPVGSTATMLDITAVRPTFTPDLSGTYLFTLVVDDGKVASVPAVATVISISSFNRLQTEKLKGNWTFNYTVGSSIFTNSYTLSNIAESTVIPGDFTITNENSTVAGIYGSSSGLWVVLDTGRIIDRVFSFHTDGSNVSAGCYQHINHPNETWTSCYPLSGSKALIIDNAVSVKSKAASILNQELSDQMRASESMDVSPPSTSVLEAYNQLKATRYEKY